MGSTRSQVRLTRSLLLQRTFAHGARDGQVSVQTADVQNLTHGMSDAGLPEEWWGGWQPVRCRTCTALCVPPHDGTDVLMRHNKCKS